MKQNDSSTIFFLFCIGIVGGILLLKLPVSSGWRPEPVSILQLKNNDSFKADPDRILEVLINRRAVPYLLLFFSCYCEAGFWLLSGMTLYMGIMLGFLTGSLVLNQGLWGGLLLVCLLCPQWLFYGYSFHLLCSFMRQQRRVRKDPGRRVGRMKPLCYLLMPSALAIGIFTEVYVNPYLLKWFLYVG